MKSLLAVSVVVGTLFLVGCFGDNAASNTATGNETPSKPGRHRMASDLAAQSNNQPNVQPLQSGPQVDLNAKNTSDVTGRQRRRRPTTVLPTDGQPPRNGQVGMPTQNNGQPVQGGNVVQPGSVRQNGPNGQGAPGNGTAANKPPQRDQPPPNARPPPLVNKTTAGGAGNSSDRRPPEKPLQNGTQGSAKVPPANGASAKTPESGQPVRANQQNPASKSMTAPGPANNSAPVPNNQQPRQPGNGQQPSNVPQSNQRPSDLGRQGANGSPQNPAQRPALTNNSTGQQPPKPPGLVQQRPTDPGKNVRPVIPAGNANASEPKPSKPNQPSQNVPPVSSQGSKPTQRTVPSVNQPPQNNGTVGGSRNGSQSKPPDNRRGLPATGNQPGSNGSPSSNVQPGKSQPPTGQSVPVVPPINNYPPQAAGGQFQPPGVADLSTTRRRRRRRRPTTVQLVAAPGQPAAGSQPQPVRHI